MEQHMEASRREQLELAQLQAETNRAAAFAARATAARQQALADMACEEAATMRMQQKEVRQQLENDKRLFYALASNQLEGIDVDKYDPVHDHHIPARRAVNGYSVYNDPWRRQSMHGYGTVPLVRHTASNAYGYNTTASMVEPGVAWTWRGRPIRMVSEQSTQFPSSTNLLSPNATATTNRFMGSATMSGDQVAAARTMGQAGPLASTAPPAIDTSSLAEAPAPIEVTTDPAQTATEVPGDTSAGPVVSPNDAPADVTSDRSDEIAASNAPVESAPANAPVESAPANAPVESAPANAPVESAPANAPVESAPANAPVESAPANAPVESAPANAPVESAPAIAPVESAAEPRP
jgi:hypothetical protein